MKTTKKLLALLFSLVMALSLVACGGSEDVDTDDAATEADTTEASTTEDAGSEDTDGDVKNIAVLLYDGTCTYIGTVRTALQEIAEKDDSINFEFHDGKLDTAVQTEQLNNVISKGVDGLLININDVTAADNYLQVVRDSGIPALFFNRDMSASLDDASEFIFVGTDAPEAGVMQGEMFVDLYNELGETLDRNGDGKIGYTILHGGLDNPEAQARSEFSVKAIEDAGIEMEELDMQVGSWSNRNI